MQQVMLDIETLGREPGSTIVSIGAVKFGPDGLGEEFYRSVSLKSCDRLGLEVDIETLEWWLEQDDAAQEELGGGNSLEIVLQQFSRFYRGTDEVWANSPSFDCEIMEAAYDVTPLDAPWEYDEERDHRTLRELPQAPSHEEMDDIGTEHNALDDAVYQAKQAHRTLSRIGYYE